jgi:hypothetical protein
MKERRGFRGETIMVQMVNLRVRNFMVCKPQARTVDVSETGLLIPATESC